MQPPAWVERILRAVLPEDECDFVLGDLREEFAARQQRAGSRRALLWYVAEAARSLWPLMSYSGQWRRNAMTGWGQDLRGALRVFVISPGFAAVVVLTLAIGVGSAAAVYSVVSGVVLSPMPFADPERVVLLWGETPEYPRIPLTVGDHNDLVAGIGAFEGVAAEWGNTALILGEAEAEQVSVGWVTPEYFEVLGVDTALGRRLAPNDDNAILLSHDLWQRRYGADPAMVGRVVDLSGSSLEVVGILRPDQDPNLTTFAGGSARHQVWRLMPRDWTQGDDRSVGWLRSTARLRDGVTLETAQAEVDAFMQQLNATVTERDGGTDLRVNLVTARADLVGGVSRTLWILLGAVCGVLMIAASNVAHLMLGRGELRRREVAVRAALGGSRMRLVRQLLIESGVLAGAGALAGLLVAWWGIQALVAMAPPSLPRLEQVRLDAAVFAFALLATAVTAIVFGVVPAIRVTRAGSLRSLGARHSTGGRRQQRLSRGLIVAQVALSLALVTGTGLLLKSLDGLSAVDLGFDTEGVITFALEAPDWGGDNTAAAARMIDYIDRVEALPGVSRAGFTNRVPLAGGLFTGTFRSEEMVAAEAPTIESAVRYVTPGYLEAMGARLSAGRGLRRADGIEAVLVDETAAARAWPGQSPLGKRVQIALIGEQPAWAEVVGVVAPMKHAGVAEAAVETIFVPMLARANQQNYRYMAVRVAGDPVAYLQPLRAAARTVDGNAVIARPRTMTELFAEDVAATRFAALLLSLFGGVALLLATVGLHGVMAVALRARRREMGIRMALGAEPRAILRAAVGAGAALVLLGVATGVVLSLGLGQLIASLLFDVQPHDALTLVVAAAVILGVGFIGAYLPARLVLRVDPATTLRDK